MGTVLKTYIGIDPGLSGAIAFITGTGSYTVFDIPIMAKGTGTVKSEINANGMRQILIN